MVLSFLAYFHKGLYPGSLSVLQSLQAKCLLRYCRCCCFLSLSVSVRWLVSHLTQKSLGISSCLATGKQTSKDTACLFKAAQQAAPLQSSASHFLLWRRCFSRWLPPERGYSQMCKDVERSQGQETNLQSLGKPITNLKSLYFRWALNPKCEYVPLKSASSISTRAKTPG